MVAADGAEGPEEDSGSRSNRELAKGMGTEKQEDSGHFSLSIISEDQLFSSVPPEERNDAVQGFNANSVEICIFMQWLR